MITFAAFTPHSPLLIESIGKENTSALTQTQEAMQMLSDELYASRPDLILTISTHRGAHENAFSLNTHKSFVVEFQEFGDFSTHGDYETDLEFVTRIQRRMRREEIAFTMDSDENLDYGVGVPLTLLNADALEIPIVPINYSYLSAKTHVQFGRILADICQESQKRIAIIASGDLSHTLSSDAPGGFNPAGERVDQSLIQAIEHVSLAQLLSIEESLLEDAQESAYKPLLLLFGLIEKCVVRPEILSYEHPFGVGLLVAHFHVSRL